MGSLLVASLFGDFCGGNQGIKSRKSVGKGGVNSPNSLNSGHIISIVNPAMMTTTHILIGAALSSRPRFKPYQIVLAWLGGFAPDLSIFIMVGYSRFVEIGEAGLWRYPDGLYWQQPWQFFSAVSNSFPMWITICLLAYFAFAKIASLRTLGLGVLIFSTAALAHISVDFFTHARDAHVQFWPFSDWRFNSPISYYDPEFYGKIVATLEIFLGLGLISYLFLQFKNWPVRMVAVLCGIPYLLSVWFIATGAVH